MFNTFFVYISFIIVKKTHTHINWN